MSGASFSRVAHKHPFISIRLQEGSPCSFGLKEFGLILVYESLCNIFGSVPSMWWAAATKTRWSALYWLQCPPKIGFRRSEYIKERFAPTLSNRERKYKFFVGKWCRINWCTCTNFWRSLLFPTPPYSTRGLPWVWRQQAVPRHF